MLECITLTFPLSSLYSASGASVVAIDNKIEQAMVSVALFSPNIGYRLS